MGHAQSWERVYTNFLGDRSLAAKRVAPATDGGFHVLISESYTAASGGPFSVMKIDADGNIENTASFGNNENHLAIDMIETANGDLVILTRTGDGWSVDSDIGFWRIDADYNILATNTIGADDIYEQPRSIVELSTGEFWMTGLGGVFPINSFLRKLDAQGQEIGNPIYDGMGSIYMKKVLLGANDGALVAGYDGDTFINSYDSNGSFLNQLPYDGFILNDFIRAADGGMLIGGRQILVKTDNTGTEEWRKEYTSTGFINIVAVGELSNGYRVLYHEQTPVLPHLGIMYTDLQGNELSRKNFAIHYSNIGAAIEVLPDDGVLVAGQRQVNPNRYDAGIHDGLPYIIRTDATGNTFTSAITGIVNDDNTDDCQADAIDLSVGQFVSVFQDDFPIATTQVDDMGNYNLPALPGAYKLAVNLPNFLWSSCQDSIDIVLPANDTIVDQDFVIAYNNELLDSIHGYIFEDFDTDCVRDSFENIGYEGWIVHLSLSENGTSINLQDTTDASGYYSFTDLMGMTNGAYGWLYFEQPIGTGLNCSYPCWQEAEVGGPFAGTSFEFNNGVKCDTLPFCPIMSVFIATDEIRSCNDEQYIVNYCNIGGYTATDAYIEVTIDSALSVTGASVPWDIQMGNVYTFQLGDLLSNECGSIEIDFTSPCDDPLGTTYCSQVYAYPDSTCNSPGPEWDGSEIELTAECVGDSVRFTIKNTGDGDMAAPLGYIVIEDNVLLYNSPGSFQLPSGTSMPVSVSADGSFYRMSSEQSEGFPGLNTPVVWIEGCNSSGDVELGFVNQYPLGDNDSWEDIFCIESVNSYDPNDKNGFPRGVGEEHYIDQNVSLEYMIRFQNEGTAEALIVEIRDTLDTDRLNPYSIRPGAASHPYTWDIEGNGVLVFRFEDINLPYVNANEEGSKGFVQFKINQRVDLPIGTEINNTAAIYFDHNPPVITNQTKHVIGDDYLPTGVREVSENTFLKISLYPNPTKDWLYVEVPNLAANEALTIQLFDILGNVVYRSLFENNTVLKGFKSLPSGMYMCNVYKEGELIGVEKVIKD